MNSLISIIIVIILSSYVNTQVVPCSFTKTYIPELYQLVFDGWLFCDTAFYYKECFHHFNSEQITEVEWDTKQYKNKYCNVTELLSNFVKITCSCPVRNNNQIYVKSKLYISTNGSTVTPTLKPIDDGNKFVIVMFVLIVSGIIILICVIYCVHQKFKRDSYTRF